MKPPSTTPYLALLAILVAAFGAWTVHSFAIKFWHGVILFLVAVALLVVAYFVHWYILARRRRMDEKAKDGASHSISQTMTSSPGAIQAGGNVVVGAPVDRFAPPSEDIVKGVGARLAAFKIAYPTARVYIQSESGSSTRRQVGIVLGQLVAGIGQFNDGTYIGNFPGSGATLLCSVGNKEMAGKFLAAISGYLSGDIAVQEIQNFGANLKLHLNGNPSFTPNGLVDIR